MTAKTTMVLDVGKLVEDAGGAIEVARICGRTRQGVYYWVAKNRMGSGDLLTILNEKNLSWADYMTPRPIEEVADD